MVSQDHVTTFFAIRKLQGAPIYMTSIRWTFLILDITLFFTHTNNTKFLKPGKTDYSSDQMLI